MLNIINLPIENMKCSCVGLEFYCKEEPELCYQHIVCHNMYQKVILLCLKTVSFLKVQTDRSWLPLLRLHRSIIQIGNDLIKRWLRTVMTLSPINKKWFCRFGLHKHSVSSKFKKKILLLQWWNCWALCLHAMLL